MLVQTPDEINLIVNNREYIVSLFFDPDDYSISFCFSKGDNSDFKEGIASIIANHIVNDEISVDEIMNDEKAIKQFIEKMLESDYAFKDIYDKLSKYENIYQRFIISVNKYYYRISKEACARKIGINTSAYENMLKSAMLATKAVNNSTSLLNSLNEIALIAKKAFISSAPYLKIINQTLENFGKELSKILSNIAIPTVSEERKSDLLQSAEQWGKYGWTIIPNAPISIYYSAPKDINEADNIALEYCTDETLSSLFEKMNSDNIINKSRLNESILCYEHNLYTPCAMLLFSLVDEKLIKLQEENERRSVGYGAVKKLKRKILSEQDSNKMLLMTILCKNILSCAEEMFKDGNNFLVQPNIINRNFLQHGMNQYDVSKKECIQLFLLYDNICKLIELFEL